MSKKPEIPKTNVPKQTPFQAELKKMGELFWQEVAEKKLEDEAREELRQKHIAIMLEKFPAEMQAELDGENASKDFVDDVLRGVKKEEEEDEEEETEQPEMAGAKLLMALTLLVASILSPAPKPKIACPEGYKKIKGRRVTSIEFGLKLNFSK